jgi:hypothetical protein
MSSNKIKFSVQYQPLRKGVSRPEDWGSTHGYELDAEESAPLLPNVGDYVSLVPMSTEHSADAFHGKVRSRLFSQFTRMAADGSTAEVFVSVNIVVEETDDDWGKLIKE